MIKESPLASRSTAQRIAARTSAVVVAAAVAVALGQGADAAGSERLTRPTTVVDPKCTFESDVAKAWTSPTGVENVVYQVSGNESFTCISGTQWFATREPGGKWIRERTPYVGTVMAVAGDDTGVYLMYADPNGVHLVRRTTGGGYERVQRLSAFGLGTFIIPAGSLAVQDGKWWAVWTENNNPEGFGLADLWQAKTVGGKLSRTRITDTPGDFDDQPSLAVRSDGSAFLLWTDHPDDDTHDYVRYGESTDGTWTSEQWDDAWVGAAGDVAVGKNDVLSVVWNRSGTLQYADDRSGSFVRQQLRDQAASSATVAAAGRHVYVSTGVPGFRTHLMTRRSDGTWKDEPLTSTEIAVNRDVAASARGATVYYSNEKKLLSRSTR